jgi:extradiol dioxygenase family protein
MPKIEHMAMYCHNLETIKVFYEKYFGCKSGVNLERNN